MSAAAPAILISGMLAANPGQGGATWAVLQYVLGLRDLGCSLCFIEPISNDRSIASCERIESSESAAYFRKVVERFGIINRSALLEESTRHTVGLPYDEILKIARRSDLLINISGMLRDNLILEPIPRRLYLDLDPAFNQLWHAQGVDVGLTGHTHFATIGLSIGRPECRIPTCGVQWIKTLQPIVLSCWPFVEHTNTEGLTTIGNWRAYGSIEHEGAFYGQKVHSLRLLGDIPLRIGEPVSIAMSIHPDEMQEAQALIERGWRIVDPEQAAGTPDDYQHFIQSSWAELGVAKSGYVVARCGWFSDRSVAYLASGRPVIAQDTGFGPYLPCDGGLSSFRTIDDVVGAVEQLRHDYARCRMAARAVAHDYFDSRKVLPALLEQAEVPL